LTDREKITFGDREWIRSVLTNFSGHFARLANIKAEDGASEEQKARSTAAAVILDGGSMATWSQDNGKTLQAPENSVPYAALVEFLYAQSGRADAVAVTDPVYTLGRSIFKTGKLQEGVEVGACSGCHTLQVRDEETVAFEGGLPNLTGYGGHKWLLEFISNPAEHYGDNNAMPAFAA
jgi:ubiquinol-cytochrome c reductase cytochrome b subunit